MPDWTTYAVAGRVLERLLVVCFAGLSVYLGHRLFLQIPDVRDAQGEIKLPAMNMTMKVSRVGPGIFFAVFGVAVLLASFLHPVSIESTPRGESAAVESQGSVKFTGSSSTQSEQDQLLRRRIVAHSISTLNGLQARLSMQSFKGEGQDPAIAVRDAKFVLMDFIWDPSWGDPASFKEAVLKGRTADDKALAQQTREAVRFYYQMEGK